MAATAALARQSNAPAATPAAAPATPLAEFRPASLGLATIGLCLGTFMQVLDLTIANVSLPTIAGNLGVSQDQSTWVITSFTVCQAIMLPMTGFLSRRFGEVKVFLAAALLFTVFSLMCGLATSLSMLVLFRALQGAACGPMYPITQSLMVSIYPRDKRAVALSIITMITVVAPIVGPVAGGWITDSYSWRWIFFINVPLGVFAVAVVFAQMGKRVEQLSKVRLDRVGLVTLILGVGALQILLDKGQDDDWFHSGLIVTLAIVAAISLCVFVIWELTEEKPLVDLRLLRHRNFAAGTLAMVLGYALFFSVVLMLPLWLQSTLGYTALWSGMAAAPLGFIPVLLTYWVGKYAHKFDLRWMASFSFVVIGLACFRLGGFDTDVNFGAVALTELLMGLGVTFFFLPILTITLSDLEGPEVAEGSGSSTFLRTLGASFAISIVTYLWARGGDASHVDLVKYINPFSPAVRSAIAAMGGNVQHYLTGINGTVTQQATQISFNHILDGLGVGFFILIAVIWFAKPPFIARGGGQSAGH